MTDFEFAVLGAGPAGLGAAHQLSKRGFGVVVLERASQVGGLAGSFEVAGQSVDHGSHRLHPSTPPEILGLLQTLLGDELQIRRRNGRIRLDDRWVSFPLSPADMARSLGPSWLLTAGLSATAASLRPKRDTTFADYVTTALGRVIGEEFYFPYARKIWGLEPEEISGVQARRRISADSPLKLLRRVVGARRGIRGSFYYPARGYGRISAALASAAESTGAEIRLENAARRVRSQGDGYVIETRSGQVRAPRVWSTIPLTRLADLFETAPESLLLEYRAMILVYLVVPRDRYTPYDAHYLPSEEVAPTRVSEPKNYRDGPDPGGQTVLCLEIPCSLGDRVWSMSDADLGALASDSLIASGLPDPDTVHVQTRRLPYAYPIYRVGFESRLDPMLEWVRDQPGLVSLGRQGLFAHDNTHHTLSMAWAAASAVDSEGAFGDRAWSASVASFQDHVVED